MKKEDNNVDWNNIENPWANDPHFDNDIDESGPMLGGISLTDENYQQQEQKFSAMNPNSEYTYEYVETKSTDNQKNPFNDNGVNAHEKYDYNWAEKTQKNIHKELAMINERQNSKINLAKSQN